MTNMYVGSIGTKMDDSNELEEALKFRTRGSASALYDSCLQLGYFLDRSSPVLERSASY
jgi:hypothetical protein